MRWATLRSSMRRRNFSHIILLGLLMILSTSCKKSSIYFGKTEPVSGNVFRFNNDTEPGYLDPELVTGQPEFRIVWLLFEGLTTTDPKTLEAAPGAAERWEISSDQQTYTFHLRKNLTWSDGKPITARDFVYSWTRALDPKTASQYANNLYHLVNGQEFNQGKVKDPSLLGVRAVDDATLQVHLHQPVPYFLSLTSFPTLMPVPAHLIAKYGDHWADPAHIIGNGPFHLVNHQTNAFFEFERNPRYWGREGVKLEKVVAYSISDLSTTANMYESGMLDWVPSGGFPPEYVASMKRFRDLKTQPFLANYFYSFNTTRPPLDNPMVRRALSMAVDRKAITDDLIRGGQIPGANFVPVGFPAYQSPPGPEYNPKEAARLLAEAGYSHGQNFRPIEILFNTAESHKKVAEAIQQMWSKNLNITVTLHNEEWATFLKRRQSLDYDVGREGWIADYPDPSTFTELLESTNGNNETGWKNQEYDRLQIQARKEIDNAKRMELFQQAEKILVEEMPVLPIYTYTSNSLIKPYVRGFLPSPMDRYQLDKVWIDYDWQKHQGLNGARGD